MSFLYRLIQNLVKKNLLPNFRFRNCHCEGIEAISPFPMRLPRLRAETLTFTKRTDEGTTVCSYRGFGGLSACGKIRRSNGFQPTAFKARFTHSSTGKARGLLRRRIKIWEMFLYFRIGILDFYENLFHFWLSSNYSNLAKDLNYLLLTLFDAFWH